MIKEEKTTEFQKQLRTKTTILNHTPYPQIATKYRQSATTYPPPTKNYKTPQEQPITARKLR
jgi:hypothetical protein